MAGDAKADTKKQPNEVDREIGRRIKARRSELGLNQQALAQHIGVSYQQVQKYENGTDRVGASRLLAIAQALRSDISEFFDQAPGLLREGGVEYEIDVDLHRLLSTDDGRALAQAFVSVDDTVVRRKLVELAQALVAGVRRPNFVRRPRRIIRRREA